MNTTRQGWYEFVPEGVNLPNKMTLGAWVILAIVVTAILAGVIWMVARLITSRIPWKKLPGNAMNVTYYGEGFEPNVMLLSMAFTAVCDFLVEHTTWKGPDIVRALMGTNIYVKPTKEWKDGVQEVAGLDPEGSWVLVGVDFAALLHECAHQVEDVVDHKVDYAHAGWEAKGIYKADAAFSKWLSTQRVASGITNLG